MLLGLMLSPMNAQGSYPVHVGDTFSYDIVKSQLDVTVEDNSTSFMGCDIGTLVPVGEQFQINVTFAIDSSVAYDQLFQNYSKSSMSTSFYLSDALIYRFDTVNYFALSFVTYWSSSCKIYSNGLPIESIFFFDLEDNTWDNMKDALVIFIGDLLAIHTTSIDFSSDIKFKETKKEYQAEWYLHMHFANNLSDYVYSLGYKLVYSAVDGTLLGAHMKGYSRGLWGGYEFDLSFDQQVEKVGYDLDGFEIGEFKTVPGYNWFYND